MKLTGPIKLTDAFKQATDDQDKVVQPEETVARVKGKMATMDLKILEQTIRIDNGRLDIPVFFSTCGHDAREVIGTRKQMGKGATPTQAEASAVMELVERFSFFSFYKNADHTKRCTYDQVADRARSENDDVPAAHLTRAGRGAYRAGPGHRRHCSGR